MLESVQRSPEGLERLCKARGKQVDGDATAFFFVATFEDMEQVYPVYDLGIRGGACSWGFSYKLIHMEEYSTSARGLEFGALSHCDESGQNDAILNGHLPGHGTLVTSSAD